MAEILAKQQAHSLLRLQAWVGKTIRVLIEGTSKKSDLDYCGRGDCGAMAIFPAIEGVKPGQYANVYIERCTSATLIGRIV